MKDRGPAAQASGNGPDGVTAPTVTGTAASADTRSHVSRRALLRGGLLAGAGVVGAGVAGGFVGSGWSAPPDPTTEAEPFAAFHQGGVVTNTQRIEISPDLRTLTMTVRLAGQTRPKNILVFERE